MVAECSEKELFFLKPGLDYTSNLLHEITEKLYGSKTVEELAEEIEREVRRGSKLPCMTAGYSIHDGIMLYLRGLMFQKEHDDMEEILRFLAKEGCKLLAKNTRVGAVN